MKHCGGNGARLISLKQLRKFRVAISLEIDKQEAQQQQRWRGLLISSCEALQVTSQVSSLCKVNFFKTLGLHGASVQNKRGLKENRTALVWDNEDLLWIRAALESENMHHNVWKSCGTGARDLVFTLWKNCSSTEITNTFRVTWKSPQQGVKAEKSRTFMFYLQSTSVTIGGLLIRRFVWSRSVIRCSNSAVAFVFLSSCWKWELRRPPHQHHHQQCVCTDHTVRAAPTQLCSAVTGRLFCFR